MPDDFNKDENNSEYVNSNNNLQGSKRYGFNPNTRKMLKSSAKSGAKTFATSVGTAAGGPVLGKAAGMVAGNIASNKTDEALDNAEETANELLNQNDNVPINEPVNNETDKESNNNKFFNNPFKSKDSKKKDESLLSTLKKIRKYRRWIFIGGGLFIFILILFVIFAGKDYLNLDLIGDSGTSNPTNPNQGNNETTPLSVSEVESAMLYIGDSRTVGLKLALGSTEVSFIAESGQGYNWFINHAKREMIELFNNKDIKYVVFALGVNDINNVDNYINVFNGLVSDYPDIKFYYLSVNPVDDSKTVYVKNSQIESFNTKIKDNVGDKYIDTYSRLSNIDYDNEGLHYDSNTYLQIHSYSVDYIANDNAVISNGGNYGSGNATIEGSDFVFYYQYNYQDSYGYGTTIASSGCGPTSMAIVLSNLLRRQITPVEMANYSLDHGYRVEGNGTAWAFFPAVSEDYGVDCEMINLTKDNILNNLRAGKLLIIGVDCCTFTDFGHFMVLRGVDSNGNILIADPASEVNSHTAWDINVFIQDGVVLWSFTK